MKKLIEQQILYFGFLPMLTVMEGFEKDEQYEMCQLIQEVLREQSKRFEFEIPVRYDEHAIKLMEGYFMLEFNLTGSIALANHVHYAERITFNIVQFIKKNLEDDTFDFDKALKTCLNSPPLRTKK